MPEPADDTRDSRALMRAYLQQRKLEGPLTTGAFLSSRPAVDDALRAWLHVAEGWSEAEIEERLQKLDDESGPVERTVPIERPPEFERTMPLDPAEFDEPEEPPFDGRYRILRVIGEGGCGKVYLVEDLLQDKEEVALKVVRHDLADAAQFEQRFRNEIRVLRALSHPRIPQIFNDGKTPQGDIYYTMSFVPGESLADILDNEAPLAPTRIVALVRQVIEVLEYAHGKGVVHRDLKPSNIMILQPGTPGEQVRVLDFGIAKILSREGVLEKASTMQTMAMLGTPHYMSPEQVSGQPIDPATDIYALGVIVYQMCSGNLPFTGGAVMELLTARLRTKPPKLSDEQIPSWLRRLVEQLLEKEGRKRPSTQQIHAIFERGMLEGAKSTRRNLLAIGVGAALAAFGVYAYFARAETPAVVPTTRMANLVAGAGDPLEDPVQAASAEGDSDQPEGGPSLGVILPIGGADLAGDAVLGAADLALGLAGEGTDIDGVRADEALPPEEPEPVAPAAPVLETVRIETPEVGLVTNMHALTVSGACDPGLEFELALGLAEEAQRKVGRSEADGTFEHRISLPLADGRYTLVVENDGKRVGERTLRVDRTAPVALETARLMLPGPFAFEDGSIEAQFRFDEGVVMRTAGGEACGELPLGTGILSFPLPSVDSADPMTVDVPLVVADELGNERSFSVPVDIFSSAVVRLANSSADDLESFTFTTGSATFPPRIGYDLAEQRFLITDSTGATRVWGMPEGTLILGRLEAAAPYHVFGIDSGNEKTQMVLVCGARSGALNEGPFLIDRREVAWVRYQAFVEASPEGGRSFRDYGPNLPEQVTAGVQWRDADAFATWAGKRLPTANQWEIAAGWNGNGWRRFPWGEEFQPDAISVHGVNDPVQSSDADLDTSPWGVQGMGAGVREWIADIPSTRSRRVTRGGTSYARVPFGFTLADDYDQSPGTYDGDYGVKTAEKTLRLLDTPSNLKDVGLRCIIPLEAR